MNPKFHNLKVKKIIKETEDCVSIQFIVPENLKESYQFIPGQYLTLRTIINDEDVRRSYSICSSGIDDDLTVAVKRVSNGKFSTFANSNLKIGDELQVLTPMGKFHSSENYNSLIKKNYVAFCSGSGITPILSIIKAILIKEPKSSFTLFYGNQTTDSIIFRDELDALKNKHMNNLSIHYLLSKETLSSPLFCGRIDKEKCEYYFKYLINVSEVDEYFLCGPEEMIFNVKEALNLKGVEDKKIHFELFNTDGLYVIQKINSVITNSEINDITSNVTVILDGFTFDFKLPKSGKILDAALTNGADLPFACKGGVCCTCKAKLIEGKVSMDLNYALEKEEVEAGYILTCQSHPITERVIVSFDEN